MTRQLINLIGGLVTVLVLVAGVLLIGLPMYSGSKTADGEADDVARSNDTQQTVIDGLRAQQAKFDQLEAEVSQLRQQIATEPRVDDILALAIAGAAEHGGTIDSLAATEAEPFAVRTAEQGVDGAAPEPVSAAASGGVASDGSAPPAEETAGAAASAAPTSEPAASETDQQQVKVTLGVTVPSVEAATAIVDSLRRGPRVVAITKATTTTEDESIKLSVEMLVFVNRS